MQGANTLVSRLLFLLLYLTSLYIGHLHILLPRALAVLVFFFFVSLPLFFRI